ncbi:sialate O-acetylesterase [Sphingomonas sp. RHCKR47]|uniref:sialate O-acetylesterase n=1 Tax=Sphingomonas citricola TaxID=2862498 RepID=UPI001CA47336|nr:sialate O-acetylesterase [Sphingomonas citricola]MBW6523426.1 sialate O-acetylesterase [Sphingomonas citricola]
MSNVAELPILADRYTPCVRTIRVVGVDLTGVAMQAQVRLRGDTPGAPEVDLATVTNGNAEGLRLIGVTVTDGVPTSTVELVINETTMEGLPYQGEIGDTTALAWDWQATFAGRKRRIAAGPFLITGDGVTGADNAPSARPIGYGMQSVSVSGMRTAATLTFGDDVVEVRIDGIDLLAPLLAGAGANGDRAEEAAATAVQARDDALAASAPIVSAPRNELVDDRGGLLGGGSAIYVPLPYYYKRGTVAAGNAGGVDMPSSDEMVGYAKVAVPPVSDVVTALIYRQATNRFELIPFANGDLILPTDGVVDVLATIWGDAIHSKMAVRRAGQMMGANQNLFGRTMRQIPRTFLTPAYRTETEAKLLAMGLTESYAPAADAAFAGDNLDPGDTGLMAVIAYTLTTDQADAFGVPIIYFRDAQDSNVGSVNPRLVARLSDRVRRYEASFTIPKGATYYLAGTGEVASGARAGVLGIQHHIARRGTRPTGIARGDFPAAPAHNGTIIIPVLGQSNAIGWGAGGPDPIVDSQDMRVLQQLPFGLGVERASAITAASWASPNGNMDVAADGDAVVLTSNGADPTYPAARFQLSGLAQGTYRVEMDVAAVSGVQAGLRDEPQTGLAYASSPIARTSVFDVTVGSSGALSVFLIGNGGQGGSPAGTVWRVERLSVRQRTAGTAIVRAAEPLSWQQPSDIGAWATSPVFYAAKVMLALDPTLKRVVILPTAQGGTSLVNGPWDPDGGALYANMVAQLAAALATYPGAGVALYVAQGEADATAGVAGVTYEDELRRAIAGTRAVKGAENAHAAIVSMVPEWVADPGAPNGQTRAAIDAAHRAIAATMPDVSFVNGATGFATAGDIIHYTREGARRNGRAAGAALS